MYRAKQNARTIAAIVSRLPSDLAQALLECVETLEQRSQVGLLGAAGALCFIGFSGVSGTATGLRRLSRADLVQTLLEHADVLEERLSVGFWLLAGGGARNRHSQPDEQPDERANATQRRLKSTKIAHDNL